MAICFNHPLSARDSRRPPGDFALALLFAVLLAFVTLASGQASGQPGGLKRDDSTPGVGEGIYRRGALGTGDPVKASRDDGARTVSTQGVDVACAKCHRRSGLGSKEGRIAIPPITGRYLFRPRHPGRDEPDLPYVEGMKGEREPYTDATLARAIREGIDSEGKPLNFLMPNFELGDADMAAVVAYLKGLDRHRVPGVTDTALHFATIITPDADPVKRRGMLDVMKQFFADRNQRQMAPAPRMRSSNRATPAKSMFMVHRRWELHVWELTGPDASWREQLERHLAREPVFAVISGLGGRNWAPVHEFCEREALPCLFPNVDAPPSNADRDVYSLYFSKGVLLEADLIANRILDAGDGGATKAVQQIYRDGDVGEAAAQALAGTLKQHGIAVSSRVLPGGVGGAGMTEAMRMAPGADTLVLWLRPDDVAALDAVPAPPAEVYLSGRMGGLERARLPSSWRERTRIAYPFDLEVRRRVRVDYARGWFRIRNIPVVAEQVQADTYLACGLVSETLNHMVDTFVRDYLIERIEDTIVHRIVTGYYPRLALATGQRFASKGGYIVRFSDPQGTRVVADQNWLVP